MNPRRTLPRPAAALAAVLAVLTALTLAACTSDSSDSKTYSFESATSLGAVIAPNDRKPVAEIAGKLLGGGTTTVAARKGKIVVMPFWASWCGPCRVELPMIANVQRDYAARGVDTLGVNSQDQRSNAEAFVRGNDIDFPSLYDQKGEVPVALGDIPAGLPFTVIVDRRGRVAAVYTLRFAAADLEKTLNTLRAEK